MQTHITYLYTSWKPELRKSMLAGIILVNLNPSDRRLFRNRNEYFIHVLITLKIVIAHKLILSLCHTNAWSTNSQ